MCETLKREFYAACPIWYWPVLWWQFAVMAHYLADLYAATGRAEMSYGLALGPFGTLRLVHLSDTARHFAMHGCLPAKPWFRVRPLMLESPSPEHPSGEVSVGMCRAPVRAAIPSPQLYLDPG